MIRSQRTDTIQGSKKELATAEMVIETRSLPVTHSQQQKTTTLTRKNQKKRSKGIGGKFCRFQKEKDNVRTPL